ncbi:hypothetical protein PBRA_005071 [Plasmodiophora brassicae]|uniref:Uncharacterized protein n=1 Tax=Plasmodiophora brassicae TaxID=37360 RepID=A0A0G4IMR6_PLABS|nr:hypothetical protein PBRA_005071 [Plasmodiophora brassicae]
MQRKYDRQGRCIRNQHKAQDDNNADSRICCYCTRTPIIDLVGRHGRGKHRDITKICKRDGRHDHPNGVRNRQDVPNGDCSQQACVREGGRIPRYTCTSDVTDICMGSVGSNHVTCVHGLHSEEHGIGATRTDLRDRYGSSARWELVRDEVNSSNWRLSMEGCSCPINENSSFQ